MIRSLFKNRNLKIIIQMKNKSKLLSTMTIEILYKPIFIPISNTNPLPSSRRVSNTYLKNSKNQALIGKINDMSNSELINKINK